MRSTGGVGSSSSEGESPSTSPFPCPLPGKSSLGSSNSISCVFFPYSPQVSSHHDHGRGHHAPPADASSRTTPIYGSRPSQRFPPRAPPRKIRTTLGSTPRHIVTTTPALSQEKPTSRGSTSLGITAASAAPSGVPGRRDVHCAEPSTDLIPRDLVVGMSVRHGPLARESVHGDLQQTPRQYGGNGHPTSKRDRIEANPRAYGKAKFLKAPKKRESTKLSEEQKSTSPPQKQKSLSLRKSENYQGFQEAEVYQAFRTKIPEPTGRRIYSRPRKSGERRGGATPKNPTQHTRGSSNTPRYSRTPCRRRRMRV